VVSGGDGGVSRARESVLLPVPASRSCFRQSSRKVPVRSSHFALPGTPAVSCLHFEACYYQPLQWCIEQGYRRFEGGAQGEHKMARGLLPVRTHSAHWLADARFSDAVARFLAREGAGVEAYVGELDERNPFKPAPAG